LVGQVLGAVGKLPQIFTGAQNIVHRLGPC
jgi:hypothetical protein